LRLIFVIFIPFVVQAQNWQKTLMILVMSAADIYLTGEAQSYLFAIPAAIAACHVVS
jgi:hypothetical protein